MTATTKKTTPKTKTVKAKTVATKIPVLPNNPFVYEVFAACSKQRTKAKKVEVLKKIRTRLYNGSIDMEF